MACIYSEGKKWVGLGEIFLRRKKKGCCVMKIHNIRGEFRNSEVKGVGETLWEGGDVQETSCAVCRVMLRDLVV